MNLSLHLSEMKYSPDLTTSLLYLLFVLNLSLHLSEMKYSPDLTTSLLYLLFVNDPPLLDYNNWYILRALFACT